MTDKTLTPLNLDALLRLLDGENDITVYVGAKKQGWVSSRKITTVVATYTSPRGLWSNRQHNHEDVGWSLCDAGIMPNSYNDHQTFETQEQARRHIGVCPTCGKLQD